MSFDIQVDIEWDKDKTVQDMMAWCNENFGEWQCDFIDYPQFGYVLFDDVTNAMAFKLRWIE